MNSKSFQQFIKFIDQPRRFDTNFKLRSKRSLCKYKIMFDRLQKKVFDNTTIGGNNGVHRDLHERSVSTLRDGQDNAKK